MVSSQNDAVEITSELFLNVIFSPEGPPPTHHQARPIQPDPGGGRYGPVQVPGVWGPRTFCHLEEERRQSARKGPAVFPAGTWQSSDWKHQGVWQAHAHDYTMPPRPWLPRLIVLHGSITTFNLLTSEVNTKWLILVEAIGPLRNQTTP